MHAETGPLDRLQELFRDDHIGVDIDHIQRGGDASQRGELIHGAVSLLAGVIMQAGHPAQVRVFMYQR